VKPRGVLYMSLRHAAHHWVQSVILAVCVAVTVALPLLSRVVISKYQRELTARAEATPLVVGAKGNRFDLVLAALYFRRASFEPMRLGDFRTLFADVGSGGVAVPMNVRFTARGLPIVATGVEYFELRGLSVRAGSPPARAGEAVLGAGAARLMGIGVGGTVFSDQLDSFDISKPPALRLHIVGVLERAGTPDDLAVFVDLPTAWVLEGRSHGHGDPVKGIPERLILERTDRSVSVSEEMIEYNEITPDNIATFHIHGSDADLPLSGGLFFPSTPKSGTIVAARANMMRATQMVSPRGVIDELLSYVFKLRSLLDALFTMTAVTTVLLTALIALLTARVRAAEFATLHRLGCGRWFVARLLAAEFAMIAFAGLAAAVAGSAAVLALLPDLVRSL